jgi:hypothetical protein
VRCWSRRCARSAQTPAPSGTDLPRHTRHARPTRRGARSPTPFRKSTCVNAAAGRLVARPVGRSPAGGTACTTVRSRASRCVSRPSHGSLFSLSAAAPGCGPAPSEEGETRDRHAAVPGHQAQQRSSAPGRRRRRPRPVDDPAVPAHVGRARRAGPARRRHPSGLPGGPARPGPGGPPVAGPRADPGAAGGLDPRRLPRAGFLGRRARWREPRLGPARRPPRRPPGHRPRRPAPCAGRRRPGPDA